MKKYFLITSLILAFVFSGAHYVYALQNTFKTTLGIIADDFIPPSIPTNLVATPVSSSQINLVWDASTDNVAVTGYRIFRNGTGIASTSLLSYQDTGLVASTTYDYTVEAFDSVPLYSGQSSLVSTSTLQVPPVTPPTPSTPGGSSSTGGSLDLIIYNLKTVVSQTGAQIDFMTSQLSHTKVYWGTTVDYELGSISGLLYESDHSATIQYLNPDTHYFFKIEVTNGLGVVKVFEGSFQTKKSPEELYSVNVSDFKAAPAQNTIALSWNNPQSSNFDSVRIIKSDKFFPRDISDGEIVYEGRNNSFVDTQVTAGVTYYYSIFTKDEQGNYSSGALAQARIRPTGEVEVQASSTDPFVNISVLKNVDSTISDLSLADFDFFQSGIKLVNVGNSLVIDGSKNLTISLKYEKVAELLKTIAFTLIDPEDSSKVFPFLLRVNKDKTAYEATLGPLQRSGKYEMKIIVLDYKNQGLKRLEGNLQVLVFKQVQKLFANNILSKEFLQNILILVLILISIYGGYRYISKKKEEKTGDIKQ